MNSLTLGPCGWSAPGSPSPPRVTRRMCGVRARVRTTWSTRPRGRCPVDGTVCDCTGGDLRIECWCRLRTARSPREGVAWGSGERRVHLIPETQALHHG